MSRSITFAALFCLGFAGLTVACDDAAREKGPHSSEEGLVTFWRVTDAPPLEWNNCTDAASFRDSVGAPTFSASSYLMYKLDAGGATATGQSCDTTSPSSCSDNGSIWNVAGNVLSRTDDPSDKPQAGSPCTLRFDNVWSVFDEGEKGRLEVVMNVSLVPDTAADQQACDDLDVAIAATGTNGQGFSGCTITIPVNMEFSKAQ